RLNENADALQRLLKLLPKESVHGLRRLPHLNNAPTAFGRTTSMEKHTRQQLVVRSHFLAHLIVLLPRHARSLEDQSHRHVHFSFLRPCRSGATLPRKPLLPESLSALKATSIAPWQPRRYPTKVG